MADVFFDGFGQVFVLKTAVLYLSDERQKVMSTLNELKEVLNQEAIAYQIENDLQLI